MLRLFPLLVLVALLGSAAAEPLRPDPALLAGEWTRTESTNPALDGMTVEVLGDEGTVAQGASWMTSGTLVWQNIRDGGGCSYDLEVLGSDGSYYPATMSFETLYRVTLVIEAGGSGATQTWVRQRLDTRPPPPLDGIWVRTESNNAALDGMRVNVGGGRAEVSLAPDGGTFARGDILWKNLAPSGPSGYEFEVLGSDGNYYDAVITFERRNRLRVDVGVGGAGSAQTWVRRRALTNAALEGPWTRAESNNPGNDGMVVSVGAEQATVADPAGSGYRPGDVLWQGLSRQNNGLGYDLEILGSDGSYYPATLTFVDPDRVEVAITHGGAGNAQVWVRGGEAPPAPVSIDGAWTRTASSNPGLNGMRITVAESEASVLYLPGAASQYRVGETIWRAITPSATGYALEVLGSDGSFYAASLRVVNLDRLELTIESSGAGSTQTWER